MNKSILFILLTVFALYARVPVENEPVDVVLKSGVRQRAKFVGIENDSIHLGGYIDKKFTVVTLPVASFESIKDTNGIELEFKEYACLKNDTLKREIINESVKDSNALTNEVFETLELADSLKEKSPWATHTLLIPFIKRPIDSAFAEHLQNTFFSIFEEESLNPLKLKEDDVDNCKEPACLIRRIRESNAKGALFGQILATDNDSLIVELTYFESSPEPEETSFKVSNKNPFSSALSNENAQNAVKKLLKKEIQKNMIDTVYKNPSVHYVHIETDPEDAMLAKNGGEPICRTPCTFATTDSGVVEYYAYWDVDELLWAQTTRLRIIPGDTAKASLKLKKVDPTVHIATHPEGAEIYEDIERPHAFTARIGVTPKTLKTKTPGGARLKIMKEGFRDTTISFYVMPTEKNFVEIELTPITLQKEIDAQKEWLKEHKQRKIGIALLGSSVVPLAFGGVFTYLASKDYQKAKRIKNELKTPHIESGENYKQKQQKNKDLTDSGDKRLIIGISSFGVAAGLLGAGLILTF